MSRKRTREKIVIDCDEAPTSKRTKISCKDCESIEKLVKSPDRNTKTHPIIVTIDIGVYRLSVISTLYCKTCGRFRLVDNLTLFNICPAGKTWDDGQDVVEYTIKRILDRGDPLSKQFSTYPVDQIKIEHQYLERNPSAKGPSNGHTKRLLLELQDEFLVIGNLLHVIFPDVYTKGISPKVEQVAPQKKLQVYKGGNPEVPTMTEARKSWKEQGLSDGQKYYRRKKLGIQHTKELIPTRFYKDDRDTINEFINTYREKDAHNITDALLILFGSSFIDGE